MEYSDSFLRAPLGENQENTQSQNFDDAKPTELSLSSDIKVIENKYIYSLKVQYKFESHGFLLRSQTLPFVYYQIYSCPPF